MKGKHMMPGMPPKGMGKGMGIMDSGGNVKGGVKKVGKVGKPKRKGK